MLPGIAPTGKRVEVPLVAIVHFREGKLAHEHIYWDQASVLVQLGLPDAGSLPVAGIETARKAAYCHLRRLRKLRVFRNGVLLDPPRIGCPGCRLRGRSSFRSFTEAQRRGAIAGAARCREE